MKPLRLALVISVLTFVGSFSVVTLKPAWYLRTSYPLKYPNTIIVHAHNYHLRPSLVAAVIYQESGFDVNARSDAGATGLMQLTPRTARGIAMHTGGTNFRTQDLRNPEINIRYGAWYLNHLHDKLHESAGNYTLTLAAYNAGQGRVSGWQKEDADGTLTVAEIPYAETRAYVRRIRQLEKFYRKAYPQLVPSKG